MNRIVRIAGVVGISQREATSTSHIHIRARGALEDQEPGANMEARPPWIVVHAHCARLEVQLGPVVCAIHGKPISKIKEVRATAKI